MNSYPPLNSFQIFVFLAGELFQGGGYRWVGRGGGVVVQIGHRHPNWFSTWVDTASDREEGQKPA